VLGKRLLAAESTAGAAEGSVRGAALLAGLAAGVYRSAGETAALAPRYERGVEPGANAAAYLVLYRNWLSA
jgi:glycerol kinase